MIKNIPKSAIWKKSFPVYKQFTVTNSDYTVISGSLETAIGIGGLVGTGGTFG